MDIHFPGMDGLSATRIIKEDPVLKQIRVIALTSYAMEGDAKKDREAGCDGYITKPIDTRTFLDTIRTFIDGGRQKNRSGLMIFLQDQSKGK
jgi:CheY-like chemotaxis protein